MKRFNITAVIFFISINVIQAQSFELPNPFICNDSTLITSADEWYQKRRPELLKLFEDNVYGKSPDAPDSITRKVTTTRNILNDKAVMAQIELKVYVKDTFFVMNLLEIIPRPATERITFFVGLNFAGNQSVLYDTSIRITDKWMKENNQRGIINNHATEKSRGVDSSEWPISLIIEKGFGIITCHNADLDEDRLNYSDGVQPLFYSPRQIKPDSGQWGTIGAWAWGMSRIVDYVEKYHWRGNKKVIAIGHSRLGKAALWATAQDERFDGVISNNSGCGGAAIFRNKQGEKIADINTSFPYWFCDNFKKFNNNENALPVDQHELLALIAPCPLYVASASEDQWADPQNEFLSISSVIPVYNLLLNKYKFQIKIFTTPEVNVPQRGTISYHLRSGKHGITLWDWKNYVKWAGFYVNF